jgi:hypothetical protein
VTELRFHRQLYAGRAVDAAVKVFAGFARFELRQEESYWVVELTADDDARERRVAGELCNYALGLTVRDRGVEAGGAKGAGGGEGGGGSAAGQ